MKMMEALLRAIQASVFDDLEMTELPIIGESPWGHEDCPTGVWAWSQDDDQVLVGDSHSDMRIVTYDQAVSLYDLP